MQTAPKDGRTPAARCLAIPELVTLVVKCLDLPNRLKFGLTSKTNWIVSSREIWREDIDAKALLGLLPANLKVTYVSMSSVTCWPHLLRTQFARLAYYGRFIQSMHLKDLLTGDGNAGFAPWLQDLLPILVLHANAPSLPDLFPGLTQVRFYLIQGDSSIVPFIPNFLASFQLTHVGLEFVEMEEVEEASDEETDQESLGLGKEIQAPDHHGRPSVRGSARFSRTGYKRIFEAIGTAGHVITQLSIEIVEGHLDKWLDALTDVAKGLLARNNRVIKLTLRVYADFDALLPVLAELRQLEELSIDAVLCPDEWSASLPPDNAFPSLRLLEMSHRRSNAWRPPMETLMDAISCARFSVLECFDLLDWMDPWTSIVARKWAASFRSLTIFIQGETDQSEDASDDSADSELEEDLPDRVFEPLYPCHGLRELHITSYLRFQLTDEHFQVLTAFWPNLEKLHVFDGYGLYDGDAIPARPVASLRALELISMGWPALRDLELSIDFDLPFAGLQDATRCRPQLVHFDASRSTTSDPETAADFLRSVFPHLNSLKVLDRKIQLAMRRRLGL